MKYLRNWECATCGTSVIYDSETDTLSCACGDIKDVIKRGLMKAEDLNIGNFRIIKI
jgi:DNA-directed RNA polymerase subunit RPC12/RpoP